MMNWLVEIKLYPALQSLGGNVRKTGEQKEGRACPSLN